MSFHVHPRRKFVKRTFFFLSGLAGPFSTLRGRARGPTAEGSRPPGRVEPPVSRQERVEGTQTPSTHFVFDAHLHCPSENGTVWQWYPVTRSFSEFDAYLRRAGVHKGIINSVRSQLAKSPAEFIEGNREVARYVDRYAGRFLGACVVNPLFIDEALREMEECRKQLGIVWVGELCNYTVPYEYTIKEFELLVQKAVELNMVLDVHTELEEMEYIIEKFPQATIVFPHFGDDAEYQNIFKRIDLVGRHSNCYLDTSGYGHDRVGMLEYAIKSIGPERVLFGSDFSINDPGTVIARINNSFLSEKEKEQIFSGNLRALLRKSGVSEV